MRFSWICACLLACLFAWSSLGFLMDCSPFAFSFPSLCFTSGGVEGNEGH